MQGLKLLREEHDVTQEELAQHSGVSRQSIVKIEKGLSVPSRETIQKLEYGLDTLRVLKTECRTEVLIDYLRIHFKHKDLKWVVEKILKWPFEFLSKERNGMFGFPDKYAYGDIRIAHDPVGKGRYTMLELGGKGCRQFEHHLGTVGWDWFDFFWHCQNNSTFEIKRLDLAIDDIDGILDIPELGRKCENGELDSRWLRKHKIINAGEVSRHSENEKADEMGYTVYIGSQNSHIYFCAYQKDLEQLHKMGIPLDEAGVKNRFEIRLSHDRATKALEYILEQDTIEGVAIDIIERYVCFIDRDPEGGIHPNARWERFMGEDRGELRLTMKPQPYSVERTKNWLKYGVLPSVAMVLGLDEIEGTSWFDDALGNTSMSMKQANVLEQAARAKQLDQDSGSGETFRNK